MKPPVKRNEIIGLNTPAKIVKKCDLELVFTQLGTQAWRRVRLLIQKRASIFGYNNDKTIAYAGFKITPENMKKVLDIYVRVYQWKTVFVRVKGSEIDTALEGKEWVHCWIMAHAAKNKTKYCMRNNIDPRLYTGITNWKDYVYRPELGRIETRITVPCKTVIVLLDPDHPENFESNYMDIAKVLGCDKCPFFNPKGFKIRTLRPGETTARESWLFWEAFKRWPIQVIQAMINKNKKQNE